MNGNGSLDAWEDWRKPYAERAADLAPQLKADQVSGLMLFSAHERAPGDGLSDAQKTYLTDSYLRNVLYAAGNVVDPGAQVIMAAAAGAKAGAGINMMLTNDDLEVALALRS